MDLAQTLLKKVLRVFYETRQIIIVDAVITHSALRDGDLAYIMSMNLKDLHKLVAKLKEERIIHQYNRQELREGQVRPVTQIYYYIDYRQTIDAIKWRVYTITAEIQGNPVPTSEKKEYFCNRCGSEWTQMDVLDRFDPSMGFLCHRCGNPLVHDLDRNSTGHEQSTRLNNQFKFVTELLQRIDQVHVPDNNFEAALQKARPVVRDASHPSVASIPVDSAGNRPTAVKGLANTGPKSMAVSISTSNGPTEAEIAAEKARKEKIAQQNALPEWMSNSTVTGQSFSAPNGQTSSATPENPDVKDASLQQSSNEREHADIEDYFARLKEEQAEEARKELEEEEYGSDDEDEDGEDFEDVVATANSSGGGTPTVTDRGLSKHLQPTETAVGERPEKRVKLEAPDEEVDEDGESEEDVEFEDV